MKKLILLFSTIFIFSFFNNSFAQVKNAIKVPMIGLFGGQYQLAYERGLSENISFNISGGYIARNSSQTWGSDSYKSTTTGFLVVPEVRYYFKEAIKGMYLAAFFRYKSTTQKINDTSVPMGIDVSRDLSVSSIGGGVTFGWQFLISDAFAIDMFIGPVFKTSSSKTSYENPNVTDADFDSKFLDFKITDNSPVGVRGGVSLGFAF